MAAFDSNPHAGIASASKALVLERFLGSGINRFFPLFTSLEKALSVPYNQPSVLSKL